MAQEAHEPTDETKTTVMVAVAVGTRQETVAAMLGISHVTLSKYYRDIIDTAKEVMIANLAGKLYTKAMGDGAQSVAALIFMLKTQGRWKENHETEVDNTIEVVGGLPVQDLK